MSSRLAELASAATGADLWSRSSVTKRPIGSIAKVMTAYVVLTTPGLNLNRVITVPAGVVAYDDTYDASTAGLEPGEKLTTRELLYAMMLPSGCDAAYTLAAAYGHGLGKFIGKMNATAKKLGLAKTHFTDFSGLPDPSEYSTYSTAHDLVILGRAAMRSKTFAAVVGTRTLPAGGRRRAPGPRLAQPQPAARPVPRRGRHQDRLHPGRGPVPAVRGAARRPGADRGGARLLDGRLRHPARRRGRRDQDAELGLQPVAWAAWQVRTRW